MSNLIKTLVVRKKTYLLIVIIMFLLGIILIMTANSIGIAVGTSIIASAIVTTLDLFRVHTKEYVYENIDNIMLEGGIENIFFTRDLDEYNSLINNSSRCIDITGYSLRAFIQSYETILKNKFSIYSNYKVRIIFVDPQSYFSTNRELQEEGVNNGTYMNAYNTLVNKFKDISNVEIRLLEAPLSSMIYRIDDTMYIGPYYYKESSKATHTIKLRKDCKLFKQYEEEFEAMWADCVKIND